MCGGAPSYIQSRIPLAYEPLHLAELARPLLNTHVGVARFPWALFFLKSSRWSFR
jgi:hypothetical protein